jgi:hypothetical protein
MSKLITKSGQVVQGLALHFLHVGKGERISRIEDFVAEFGVGRGTVQTAINFLCKEGAIELRSNGHLGTTLISSDKKKLWSIAGHGTILGIMPLPYSKRYEGLATALCELFEKADIPFNLAYQRGSQSRINGVLAQRYDFAVCSHLAAMGGIKNNDELDIAIFLGESSFVGEHALILRAGAGESIVDGMRVAVDPNSIDQIIMTEKLVVGKNVSIVYTPYNRMIEMLKCGEVDATIWNADEVREKFTSLDCIKVDIGIKGAGNTKAALVYNKAHKYIKQILLDVIKEDKVAEIQQMVIDNKMLPRY